MNRISKLSNMSRNMYLISFFTIFAVFITFIQTITVEGYQLLFLLPASYLFLIIFNRSKWIHLKNNVGLIALFGIEMLRLVVNPLLTSFSNYQFALAYNVTQNTSYGIILLVYETFAISLALRIKFKDNYKYKTYRKDGIKRLVIITSFVLIISIIVFSFAPEVIKNNISIKNLFLENGNFANVEQSKIIAKYGISFLKKLMLVLANYLLSVDKLLIPAVMIVIIRKFKYANVLALLISFSPFLMMDGVIARSIINCILLLLLYFNLYDISVRKMYIPILIAFVAVVFYFIFRFSVSTYDKDIISYFASITNSYFSGENIVSGTFNLPNNFTYKIYYFTRDFLNSIPFSNTIFGIEGKTISEFFNFYNISRGQIPTTIGLSSFYFTPILAPIYSVIFARKSYILGKCAILEANPLFKLIYTYTAIILALGIATYNINIAFGLLIQVALPIYLILYFSYKPIINRG